VSNIPVSKFVSHDFLWHTKSSLWSIFTHRKERKKTVSRMTTPFSISERRSQPVMMERPSTTRRRTSEHTRLSLRKVYRQESDSSFVGGQRPAEPLPDREPDQDSMDFPFLLYCLKNHFHSPSCMQMGQRNLRRRIGRDLKNNCC
jgi:hypothetical protein